MVAKLNPINMDLNEALTRIAKVPRKLIGKDKKTLDKSKDLPNNLKNGVSASPPHVVKKT